MKNNTALSAEKAITFISDDTRRNINSIYNFKTGCVKTECLHEGWQTSGSLKVVRMAFNLYCNGTPSVLDYDDVSAPMIKCKKTPKKKCRFMAERRKKR